MLKRFSPVDHHVEEAARFPIYLPNSPAQYLNPPAPALHLPTPDRYLLTYAKNLLAEGLPDNDLIQAMSILILSETIVLKGHRCGSHFVCTAADS